MIGFLIQPITIQFFSLAASLVVLIGTLISSAFYRGKQGERYSLLNHYISELGELNVSRFAQIFNLGLILCGILILPANLGLGLLMPGFLAKAGMLAGIVTAAAITLVGIFPMNDMSKHVKVAVLFFRSGLAMIFLFTLAVLFQSSHEQIVPLKVGFAGIPAICAYSYFLIFSQILYRGSAASLSAQAENRPRVWPLAVAEWMILLTTIPWLFAVAIGL